MSDQGGRVSQPANQPTVTARSTLGVLPGPEKPTTIEELHEAAGRLHACAWHGRKSVGEASRARFSIPRQPTDDDNLIYAAIEELRALRAAQHKRSEQSESAAGVKS